MKERIVALGILVFAMVYTAGAIALKVGTLAQPGAGQFPAAIALCLLAVSAFHTWRTFRKTAEKGEGNGLPTGFVPTGIAAVLVIYPVLLHALNFLLSTFIVLFVLFLLLRFKTVTVSFITALFTTLLSFVVFTVFLGVVLPTGGVEEFILKLVE
ncbi:MAG: tripartite tricarboxylate transporter TctB family protein, partial [Deltaproteobacteria bacterium]|nr:tripartite tricarboxylate transporter TctB family protein [Deltaproteobacteria bacterium]